MSFTLRNVNNPQTQSSLSYQFFPFTLSESLLSRYNTTVSISFSVSILISFYYAFSLLRILAVVTVIIVALELLVHHSFTHTIHSLIQLLAGWKPAGVCVERLLRCVDSFSFVYSVESVQQMNLISVYFQSRSATDHIRFMLMFLCMWILNNSNTKIVNCFPKNLCSDVA